MGNIKEILSETIFGKRGIYEDYARLEIEENIHFHYRDGRYIFNKEDFLTVAKVFIDALNKFIEIRTPESTKEMVQLSGNYLKESLHNNRLGCELNFDNTVHVHYRDLRLHLNRPDFHKMAENLHIANLMLNLQDSQPIDLKDKRIRLHPVVHEHNENLRKYDNMEYPKENPEDVIKYLLAVKRYQSHPNNNIKRPNGFPSNYPAEIPKELNRKYLFSLYESIKKYGYAEAPFYGQYIIIYRENESVLYVKDSHRVACLLHLGITNIKALITEPESGWSYQEIES